MRGTLPKLSVIEGSYPAPDMQSALAVAQRRTTKRFGEAAASAQPEDLAILLVVRL